MIEQKNLNSLQIIELLKNDSVEEKIEVLDDLLNQENIDEFVEPVCNLVTHPDKGIRNSASLLIINHRPEKAAHYLVQLISSKDITLRNLAGELLIKLGSRAIQALIDFNCEKNSDDQKFVIDVLGLIGSSKAADHIIGIMGSSEDDNVILACIEALGNIRHQESLDILQLLYDRSELYKPFIVESMGKIGSPKACSFLLEKFHKEDDLTKYSILESLGFVGDVDTFFFLLEQVPNIHGPLVWPLITSLFILKEKYNLDIPFDDKMKNLLMFTLQEGTPEHKKTALSLINVFSDKEILVESLKFLGDDDELDEIIRTKIYKNPEYLFEEFQRIISNSNDNLRQVLNLFYSILSYLTYEGGTLELSLIQRRNIIYAMSELLNHHDEEVRKSSMETIFLLDNEAALLFIDSMIKDENMWNRLRLVELLEPINNKIAKDALLKMTDDSEDMIKERVQDLLNNQNINEIYPNLR
ncbi:MAG: HEAT repeat domain-containing protein [Ignavibacteria bacterium]|nr:HEAT repeat domain-containing protein [Ignavibacteria bacterium]